MLADRQWLTFVDKNTVLLSYNQQEPRNIVVQRSDDGGLTYSPITAVGGAAPDFPGPIRTLPASFNTKNPGTRVVYFGWSAGSNVYLSVSYDGRSNFVDCVAAVDKRQPPRDDSPLPLRLDLPERTRVQPDATQRRPVAC